MSLPSAAAIAQPRAWGYDGRFDDLLFRLAAAPSRPLSMVGEAPDAPRVQTQALPEEFVSEFGLTFARSDFSGGEGLYRAHRRDAEESDVLRYWDSRNLRIDTYSGVGRGYATIQQDPLDVGGTVVASATGTRIVRLDDNSVLRRTGNTGTNQVQVIADPFGTPSDHDESLSTPFAAFDIVRLGATIYAAAGLDGVFKRTAAGGVQTWTQLSSFANSALFTAKGRLLAAGLGNDNLYDVDLSTGTHTLVLTGSGQEYNARGLTNFVSVVDAGPFILVASWDGYIYALEDQSGTLTLVGQTKISPAEFPQQLGYHPSGVVLLITREPTGTGQFDNNGHLYTASINETKGILEDVQEIHTFYDDGTYGTTFGRITTTRDNFYVVASAARTQDDTNALVDLWRYDVTRAALFRDWEITTGSWTGEADALFLDGKPIVAGPFDTVIQDPANLETQSWLMLPLIDFYTASDKEWIELKVEANNIDTDGKIYVYVSNDERAPRDYLSQVFGVTWTQVAQYADWGAAAADTYASGQIVKLNVSPSRYLAIKLEFYPSARTGQEVDEQNPQLTSVSVRAQVTDEDFVIDLPVNISDRIEAPGRQPFISPGWGRTITDELLDLRGTTVTLELYEPPLVAEGIIEAVRIDVPQIPEVGAATETATVRFRGRLT